MSGSVEIRTERLTIPEGCNVIFGQTHFIKTVEDLYELMVGAVPGIKFGLAFCEASGDCLVRSEGTDEGLRQAAVDNALRVAAGHTFNVLLCGAFPINVLNAVKMCQEVCTVFCATANPVEVVLAASEQGRGVLGVIDGASPQGVEGAEQIAWRRDILRRFGYKR